MIVVYNEQGKILYTIEGSVSADNMVQIKSNLKEGQFIAVSKNKKAKSSTHKVQKGRVTEKTEEERKDELFDRKKKEEDANKVLLDEIKDRHEKINKVSDLERRIEALERKIEK